uniref:C-type lectin domain-containing protein n=1 Tax=Denticeps clupeoides TaxID=299321 RepID=A0AAY4BRU6_9TELE
SFMSTVSVLLSIPVDGGSIWTAVSLNRLSALMVNISYGFPLLMNMLKYSYEFKVGSVRFVLVPDPKSWSEARSYCRAHHTDLATVRNQPENQQVQALLPAPGGAWIGLSRDAWRWSDQDESSFANWIPGEPNNFLGRAESCVEMWTWTSGQWNDEVCSLFWLIY